MEDEVSKQSAISGQPSAEAPDKELAQAKARIAELEGALAGKDDEIASLTRSQANLEAKVKDLNSSLAEAVSGYRTMVVQTNPDVLPELINGETVAALGESLRQAKALVGKVREGLEAELSRARFPAGSPERGRGDVDLSPIEKIQRGISRGK